MSLPNNFTGHQLVGIVVGGDINDPAPDNSCNMKIFIPGYHGKDVKPEHLAFSTMSKSPTKHSQQSFEGVLDPGTTVFISKDTGSNQCHILGLANEISNSNARVPGNIDLLSNFVKHITGIDPRDVEIKVRIPPTTKEETVNGALIRKKQEKGKDHKHRLLDGIPSNGAIFPLSGMVLPDFGPVSTAKESFSNILENIVTPNILGMLPGLNIPIGGMLGSLVSGNLAGGLSGVVSGALSNIQGSIAQAAGDIAGNLAGGAVGSLTGDAAARVAAQAAAQVAFSSVSVINDKLLSELSKELMSKLSPEMKITFTNMTSLMQTVEQSSGALNVGRVDPITFLTNSVSLLGKAKSIGDMISAAQQLQFDDALKGTANLPKISIPISTPFGTMPINIGADGSIASNASNALKTAFSAFESAMGNASAFPGINAGQNLFGSAAKDMLNMFGRMSGPANAAAVELSKTLNQNDIAKTFDKIVKQTLGGNSFNNMFG
jgi:hypothetical protein